MLKVGTKPARQGNEFGSNKGSIMMKVWARGVLAGSVALAFSGGASAETLKEVVTYAIDTNPQVVSVAKRREAADFAIDAARGGYFPRADFL